mmetsp:Transcript_111179/g.319471  ORF Transcript_111179/g.319471 Transcript_111179/m.319471 type:complete len:282 (+) Transcript_111179:130-975(+)
MLLQVLQAVPRPREQRVPRGRYGPPGADAGHGPGAELGGRARDGGGPLREHRRHRGAQARCRRAHRPLWLRPELLVLAVVVGVGEAEQPVRLVPVRVEEPLEARQQMRVELRCGRDAGHRDAGLLRRERLRPRPRDLEPPLAVEEVVRELAHVALGEADEVGAGATARADLLLLPLHNTAPVALTPVPLASVQRLVRLEVRVVGVERAPALIQVGAEAALVHLTIHPMLQPFALAHVSAAEERVLHDAADIVHDELLGLAHLRRAHHRPPELVVALVHVDL